jgi:hypothetical protein
MIFAVQTCPEYLSAFWPVVTIWRCWASAHSVERQPKRKCCHLMVDWEVTTTCSVSARMVPAKGALPSMGELSKGTYD